MSFRALSIASLLPGSPHGACIERESCSISKVSLDTSYVGFRVPRKGALPPGSAISYRERRFVYTALFYCLSKSPAKELPSRFPKGAPMESDARFKSLPLQIL